MATWADLPVVTPEQQANPSLLFARQYKRAGLRSVIAWYSEAFCVPTKRSCVGTEGRAALVLQGEFMGVLKGFYETAVATLVEAHGGVRQQEKENRRQLALRGDLSDECAKAFDK
eukprot:157204-Rhodomonas_salina.1